MMREDSHMAVGRIRSLRERLVEMACAEVELNPQTVDASELGAVVDMVRDLAEAECRLSEAEYHCAVTEAMEAYDGRMGYNPNRDSMGRYATPGRARRRRGYDDPAAVEPTTMADAPAPATAKHAARAGYRPGDPDMRMDTWGDDVDGERHGRAFDMYRRDKRHYTKTHSEVDRQGMRDHASEHMSETMATIREIWDDADPELRKRMKADMTKLTSEMTV